MGAELSRGLGSYFSLPNRNIDKDPHPLHHGIEVLAPL